MSVLVSGGAGYIGSHTCVELLQADYDIIVADNLSNACEESLCRVEQITGKPVPFVKAELAMGVGMVPHFNADVAAVHFVGNSGCCSRSQEGIKDKVAGICGDMDYTLDEAFRFGSGEDIIFSKKSKNFFF